MLPVGPIVGSLGGVAGVAVGAPVGGTGDDFAINDLLFKVAPTDTNQYQRATAQFRKDQFDAGQQAGDQSLTGWWTRGEFSFHKGAGVTYYEVSQGDTIVNRYLDAEGLNPWDAGKVSCQKAWDAQAYAGGNLKYVSSIGADLVVLDDVTLKYGDFDSGPTTLTPTGAGTDVQGVTVAPTQGYIVTDAGEVESFIPSGAQAVLYNGLTDPLGIWYVKSRLIVADSDGKWYQLATGPTAPPVTVGAGDVIFTGIDWATVSCVSDTPGAILIGNSNKIFALALDSTGSIPALSAPVQVGELPPGETVWSIAAHLGFVILLTASGVRVGVLSDSGQLTYGPLLVERQSGTGGPETGIARYSTRAGVVIDNRIIEIDLSEQVGTGLELAWTGRGEPFDDGDTAAGVTTLLVPGVQIAWNQTTLWSDDSGDLLAGSLTTGYHRFNTLEPKRFDSVRVHCDGAHGTVEVLQVASDGSELSLYVMDVSLTHVEQIPFVFTTGQEVVGLKFVLTPDPGHLDVSPILLGYQIRALPEPQRQRMIRVPLMLKDHERRQPARTTGTKDSAYSRLRALEDLEDSSAIVTFRDYRTGETGSAYIESVEFTNTTPPTNASSGFGGTVFLTLRKLI